MAIVLVPPPGAAHNILLMGGAGGATAVSHADITFTDGSPALPSGAAPASGSYKPTALVTDPFPAPGPGDNYCSPGAITADAPVHPGANCTLAQALNGSDPNGTWNLYVIDVGSGDAGQIAGGWTLHVTAGGTPTTAQTLTVINVGAGGTGTVRGLGISCGPVCSESYVPGTLVTLTATPAEGSSFGGWNRSRGPGAGPGSEACAGQTHPSCTVTVDAAKSITASFVPAPRTLKVAKAGSGGGTVTGLEIDCGVNCTGTYPDVVSVRLTATPAAGSRFAGWIGCESASGNTCTTNMTGDKEVTALFTRVPGNTPPSTTPPRSGASATVAGCTAGRNVIALGPGEDRRNGTADNDVIFAGPGNDVIDGLTGDDCLDLGTGNDRGQGGPGNDLLLGGLGDDRVSGSEGDDRLRGHAGKDRIHGGAGADAIAGGGSPDRIAGDRGNDRIDGNSSNDSLTGNSGRDRIAGGSGRDRISGGSGPDSISARDRQPDRIDCGAGRDRIVADRFDRVSRNCERVRRR